MIHGHGVRIKSKSLCFAVFFYGVHLHHDGRDRRFNGSHRNFVARFEIIDRLQVLGAGI